MPAISGQTLVTTAGTAVSLGSVDILGPLTIKALSANTGLVFIGSDGAGSVSASNGFQLAASEQVTLDWVGHLASLRLDAAVSGEGVCWLGLTA